MNVIGSIAYPKMISRNKYNNLFIMISCLIAFNSSKILSKTFTIFYPQNNPYEAVTEYHFTLFYMYIYFTHKDTCMHTNTHM